VQDSVHGLNLEHCLQGCHQNQKGRDSRVVLMGLKGKT
jgi:hypothetical protein